ncbi:MAG: hypothetical protein Q4C98_10495 [Capnocytophaga sp.]|nr:hypothetical protein [Capnocytophaga sp.]
MKTLKEIRTYERNKSVASSLWQVFEFQGEGFPAWVYDEQRIARKLHEFGFSLGEEDYLYICLNAELDENQIVFSHLDFDKCTLYADFGANPSQFNALSCENQRIFIQNMIFSVLKAKTSPQMVYLLAKTEQEVTKYGKNIKILHKIKETSAYMVRIFYQINPDEKPLSLSEKNGGVAIIEYLDKKTHKTSIFTYPLYFYDDIFSLMNTITLKNNSLIIKPKTSFRAEIENKHYQTPLVFEL